MNERFGNSFMVHLVGPGVVIFFACMAYQSAIGPIVHGGSIARIGLVTGCSAMAILILWLYVRTGLLHYEVSDDGLVAVRPWSRTVVPWSEIRYIDWKFAIHVIVFRGVDSVIAFSSTDLFPRMLDLLHQVRKRSQCTLDSRLEALLDDDAKAIGL